MQPNKTLKKIVFIIILVGMLPPLILLLLGPKICYRQSSLDTIFPVISDNQIDILPASLAQDIPIKTTKNSALALHIKIPILGVNALVESVGLTAQGAVDTPKGFKNAGWYNLGPRPGEIGNAVIDGHSGWKNGQQGVFNNINTLRKGDKIFIEKSSGTSLTFVVREFRTYQADEIVQDIFYSSDGGVHLNLITCEGDWNKSTQSYPERFIVFSDISSEV